MSTPVLTDSFHTSSGIKLLTSVLNGKSIAYCSETVFMIQLGKGPKGSYRNRMSFKGDLPRAVLWYNSLNIGYGYKKRLFMPSAAKNPVLARHAS